MPDRLIIRIDEELCNGCGVCITACEESALQVIDGKARLTSDIYCDGLGACVGECPQGALTIEQRQARPFDARAVAVAQSGATGPSLLENWPVQLHLVPVRAPLYDGANLLIAADCAAFAARDFHERFLPERTVVVGCPKFDDVDFYRRKLAQVLMQNNIKTVEVLYMEVPCCLGLVRIARLAVDEAGTDLPLVHTRLNVQGEVVSSQQFATGAGENA